MPKAREPNVIIDPSSRILYASFYIQGLYDVFGRQNVRFGRTPFFTLDRRSEPFAFEHYFAFVVRRPDGSETRYVVDFCDPPDISPIAYRWCDVYAKINFNPAATAPEFLAKLQPVPPGFGIRIWNASESAAHALANFFRCRMRPLRPAKEHFRDYYISLKRRHLADYMSMRGRSTRKAVFLPSTLWPEDDRDQPSSVEFSRSRRTLRI